MKTLRSIMVVGCILAVLATASANDYYTHGSFPSPNSPATSAAMRAEFDLISAGFDKLPSITGNANKAIIVNGGATGFTTTVGTFSLAGNFAVTGAFTTTLVAQSATTLTLPALSGTLATLNGSEVFTTKTFNLASNTLSGTTAQFNAALSDNDFATLAGPEILSNKTVQSGVFTGGTFSNPVMTNATISNAAISSSSITTTTLVSPTISGGTLSSPTLTSPTISTPTLQTSVSGTALAAQSDMDAGTSSSKIVTPVLNRISLKTAVAASGTAVDFTSIPSGTRRITVMFAGISTNGVSSPLIQIGDSGGIENAGYSGASSLVVDASNPSTQNSTAGMPIFSGNASNVLNGSISLNLVNPSTNTWTFSGNLGLSNATQIVISGASKSLTGELDRVRITTAGGVDTFDAGVINVSYER